MARSYKFAVLRVIPDPRRGECVNVGLVIFCEGEAADVRLLASLAKVSALNASIDLDQIRSLPPLIQQWTAGFESPSDKHQALQDLGLISVSELGTFEVSAPSGYDHAVARMMHSLVSPVTTDAPSAAFPTRIATSLRAKFKANQILGKGVEDLRHHLVIPNFPIDEDEGIYADFVVKNGAFHVTATADLRAASASRIDRIRAASLIAVTLDKSRSKFGSKTKRFVVYASRKGAPAQAVNLLGDYSDAIFHIDSKSDMASYMDKIMQAASPTKSLREEHHDR